MAEINAEWGPFVKSLLDKYKLSLRDAENRVRQATGRGVSSAYINEWVRYGKVPDSRKAYDFLRSFDVEEAIEGFRILGLPVPAEWVVDNPSAIIIELRKKREISDEKAKRIEEMMRRELNNLE